MVTGLTTPGSLEPHIWVTSLVLKAFEFGPDLILVQAPCLPAEETGVHDRGHSATKCRIRTIVQCTESQASPSFLHENADGRAGIQDEQVLFQHAILIRLLSCLLVYCHWGKKSSLEVMIPLVETSGHPGGRERR